MFHKHSRLSKQTRSYRWWVGLLLVRKSSFWDTESSSDNTQRCVCSSYSTERQKYLVVRNGVCASNVETCNSELYRRPNHKFTFMLPCIVIDFFLTLKYYRWCILYTSFSYFCLTSMYVNLPSPSSIYPQLDSLRR